MLGIDQNGADGSDFLKVFVDTFDVDHQGMTAKEDECILFERGTAGGNGRV